MDELLLDTTYLLPIFRVSAGLRKFEDAFGKLLEFFFRALQPREPDGGEMDKLRLGRTNSKKRDALLAAYRTGVKVLASDRRLMATPLTSDTVEGVADGVLVREGVKDYFDRVIYGTGADRGCVVLTEDEELLKLKGEGPSTPSEVLTWKKVLSM